MSNTGRTSRERHPRHPLVEGLRGVLVLTLTTVGVALTGLLVALLFATIFR